MIIPEILTDIARKEGKRFSKIAEEVKNSNSILIICKNADTFLEARALGTFLLFQKTIPLTTSGIQTTLPVTTSGTLFRPVFYSDGYHFTEHFIEGSLRRFNLIDTIEGCPLPFQKKAASNIRLLLDAEKVIIIVTSILKKSWKSTFDRYLQIVLHQFTIVNYPNVK